MNVAGNLAKDTPIITIGDFPERTWTQHAACAGHDPDLWFLDQHDGNYAEARAICAACPVTAECLAWAVETNTQFGMWGGVSPRERKRLQPRRRRRAS